MKNGRGIKMMMLVAVLGLALTFPLQRAARANDTGKIIAAVAAGVILAEVLDNDHGPAYAHPPSGNAWGYYNRRPGCAPCRSYRAWQPAPVIYGAPAPYYYEPAGPGVHIDVRKGPNGKTSVGFEYRDRRW